MKKYQWEMLKMYIVVMLTLNLAQDHIGTWMVAGYVVVIVAAVAVIESVFKRVLGTDQ